MNILSKVLFITCIFVYALTVSADSGVGTLRGTIRDRQTQEAVVGASVAIVNGRAGGKSDQDGVFQIADLVSSTYSIRISAVGYEPKIMTDIRVSPGRTTSLNIDLDLRPMQANEVVVAADPFQQAPEVATSTLRLAQEEIRRAPGAREDLSRAVQILPSVKMTSDDRNDLVVRGGSPTEVLFRIDGFEFPNPNHFGTQGATGGPIGIINNEFVSDVNFLAGGFPARYGDKTSAVVDVNYRDGSPKFSGSGNFGFAGAGIIAEGPFASGKGNYIASIRRSWLDLLSDKLGYGATPHYQDAQCKLGYVIDNNNRLSFLAMGGDSWIEFKPDLTDTKYSFTEYTWNGTTNGVIGLSWTHLFPQHGYTKTYLSFDRTRFETRFDTLTSFTNPGWSRRFDNTSYESQVDFRNEWTLRVGHRNEVNFGIQAKRVGFDFAISAIEPYTVNGSRYVVTRSIDLVKSTYKYAAFAQYTHNWGLYFTSNLGARYDYYDYTRSGVVSPRASLLYRLDANTKLTASYGWFAQTPPLLILTANPVNKDLKDMVAEHAVLGFEHLFTPYTRLTIEGYTKKYRDVPVCADGNRWLSQLSAGANYGGIETFNRIENVGKGRSYGAELMLQKKLQDGLYGIASMSWSRTYFTTYDGVELPSNFDSPVIVNLVAGWKPDQLNEVSVKWSYADGAPYTALNLHAADSLNMQVYDTLNVNGVRRPAYHRLDIRFDRRYEFKGWNLVTWFSIENVYNRKNFLMSLWNRKKKVNEDANQIGFFPVGGITVEW